MSSRQSPRKAQVKRKTRETSIRLEIDLDSPGKVQIQTGIGFFDHMLTALAVHGRMELLVEAEGDLHVDQHHLVEDVGSSLAPRCVRHWEMISASSGLPPPMPRSMMRSRVPSWISAAGLISTAGWRSVAPSWAALTPTSCGSSFRRSSRTPRSTYTST